MRLKQRETARHRRRCSKTIGGVCERPRTTQTSKRWTLKQPTQEDRYGARTQTQVQAKQEMQETAGKPEPQQQPAVNHESPKTGPTAYRSTESEQQPKKSDPQSRDERARPRARQPRCPRRRGGWEAKERGWREQP